jgi:hypothetical protein
MTNPIRRAFDGMTSVYWRQGNAGGGINSGGSVGTAPASPQRNIILVRGIPTNPLNQQYMPVVNASNYASVVVKGMRTPSVSLSACAKPWNGTSGWLDATFLNSLVGLGSDQNTDAFAIRFTDDGGNPRTWDWSRCEMVQITGSIGGGPIMVQMSFRSRFGDAVAEGVYGLTFLAGFNPPASGPAWTTPATDAGQIDGDADWDFGASPTISDVQSFSLTLVRGQRWRPRAGVCVAGPGASRTVYCADVDSGQFSGVLTVVQDAGASTHISGYGGATLRLNTSSTGANGGLQIAMNINEDNEVYPVESAFGTLTTTYSLINLATGGNPAVITALP